MAIIIQKVKEDLKYIPITQRGTENPFSVFIKLLEPKELLLLEDKVVRREGDEMTFAMGAFAVNICKASIIGWENISDSEGKALEFKKSADGLPLDKTLGYIGVEWLQEISNVVTSVSRDKSNISVFFPEE